MWYLDSDSHFRLATSRKIIDTTAMHGPELFADTELIMFLKLLIATLLGGIIGTERAVLARQAAGTRTFGLVALGACMFVIRGNYVSGAYLGVVNFDPTHMASAVVTGIGFTSSRRRWR